MSKPDKNKKQRIKKFDFSHADAHVALVDVAANGKSEFLVKKSLNEPEEMDTQKNLEIRVQMNDELVDELEAENDKIESAMRNTVEVPLAELLSMMGLWTDDALWISELTTKAVDNKLPLKTVLEAVNKELDSTSESNKEEEALDGASISKSDNGGTMTDKKNEAPAEEVEVQKEATVEVQKAPEVSTEESSVLKALEGKVAEMEDKLNTYKAVEEARMEKKFEDMAETYKDLGLETEHGKVLRALHGLEGSDVIFKALDTAVEFVGKKNDAKEVGSGAEGEVVTKSDVESNYEEITVIAKSLREKHPELTDQQARVMAAKQNPHLTA